jgi:uncharacterized protein (DUF1800 family)
MFFSPSPRPPRLFPIPAGAALPRPATPPGAEYPPPSPLRSRSRREAADEPASPAPPPLGVLLYTRAGFGPTGPDLAAFQALGATDPERLEAWVTRQLQPGAIADPDCDAKLAAGAYATLGKTFDQLWQDHYLPDNAWDERLQPATETELATWTRAVYSKRQLLESLVHFWHNHFNAYAYEFVAGPLWVHWDRDVVRAHAFGNFRQMLEAAAQAPVMLVYLDNYVNFADGGVGYSNENYARELLELHTLGATASFGRIPRSQVPVDEQGRPLGYCEEDVQDVARALTGWTFDIDWESWRWGGGNSGHPVRVDALHSTEAKRVLGVDLAAGRGALADGQQLFDVIAAHPATGRFLATKLCRRLVGDFPPADLVASAAALWTSLWQSPTQIAQVVHHILVERPEFAATWGEKIKRPFEIAVSALRAMGTGVRFFQQVPAPPDWNDWDPDFQRTAALHWMFEPAGQVLFGWQPPNGPPDVRAAWQCATPRVALWRLVDWMIETDDAGNGVFAGIIPWTLNNLPAGERSANAVVDAWLWRVFHHGVPAPDRAQLLEFMSQGFNPDLDLPLTTNDWPYYWQDRLIALVGLIFMSPEFLWR